MKRQEPRLVSEIISAAVDASGNRVAFDRQRLCYVYADIVGPTINSHTMRHFVDDHAVLHIYLDSAPLKNELSFLRTALRDRLNTAVGASVITDIQIH